MDAQEGSTSDEVVIHLEAWHYSLMKHMHQLGLFGWEERTEVLQDLVDWGLARGEWFGSLDYAPRPTWRLTRLGEKMLAHHLGES